MTAAATVFQTALGSGMTPSTTLRFPANLTSPQTSTASCIGCRILVVDGDHRVAILAKRDMEAGEEVFYDYNYDKRVGARIASSVTIISLFPEE